MGHTSQLDSFLNLHKEQLVSSGIPEHFWHTIHEKLLEQSFDGGKVFQLVQIEYDEDRRDCDPIWALVSTSSMLYTDPQHIYLIDHAWTYRVEDARKSVLLNKALQDRLCSIFGLNDALPKEELATLIFDKTWKISSHYSIGNAENMEDRVPVWYIMDEIGSAVLHNDRPNCRIVPFVYINEQTAYSLLFPIRDIEVGEVIYRDCAEGVYSTTKRSAALISWEPKSFRHFSTEPSMPEAEYYLSGHIEETLPFISKLKESVTVKDQYKVFTQYSLVKQYLTNKQFTLVDTEEEADILWFTQHFRDFATLGTTPSKFINQFPYEYVLTVKDLLCVTCRRSKNNLMPTTYNLVTEIANFVSYFQKRESEGLDNFWIVKPFNLARGLDTHVTNNINYIMRLPETGPKIVQKYIINPVLFDRPECGGSVKFDIRYVILLKTVRPLSAYIYKQFFLRFANIPFELNDFDVYEKHFTVMNYNENTNLKHMMCPEFKLKWEQQYPNYPWNTVQTSIEAMLKDILECATADDPPCAIAENPQSRALYAADLMLEWTPDKNIKPRILEINFTPDCKRACEYYPEFYNDIFKLFFLNEESKEIIKL